MYRIFIDEYGHDNLNSRNDPREQFLSLTGVILDGRGHAKLTEQLNKLKLRAFGTCTISLHRREIINKKPPPFDALENEGVLKEFTQGLMNIVSEADYSVITVLIDKKEHFDRYKVWKSNPYHYCLTAMMERYVMLLDEQKWPG